MQIGEQRRHLLIGEAASEARHQPLARKNDAPHLRIRGGRSAGQRGVLENSMQSGRDLLQVEIVLLMAVGATNRVEMFAFGLLRSQARR